MSTSLLYHGFGIRWYKYASAQYRQGEVIFRIEQPRESDRCSRCGSAAVSPESGIRIFVQARIAVERYDQFRKSIPRCRQGCVFLLSVSSSGEEK